MTSRKIFAALSGLYNLRDWKHARAVACVGSSYFENYYLSKKTLQFDTLKIDVNDDYNPSFQMITFGISGGFELFLWRLCLNIMAGPALVYDFRTRTVSPSPSVDLGLYTRF